MSRSRWAENSKTMMSTGWKSRSCRTTSPATYALPRLSIYAWSAARRILHVLILKPFFENPRLPILQPDPMRGGLTELRKIATVADTWGMTIAPHLFPELNVQLLASIPNGLWIEDMGLADDIWVEPVPVVKGVITAPERPGHGLAFRPEILRDCRAGN